MRRRFRSLRERGRKPSGKMSCPYRNWIVVPRGIAGKRRMSSRYWGANPELKHNRFTEVGWLMHSRISQSHFKENLGG